MSQVAITERAAPYTAVDLHINVRPLHQCRIAWLNPGWLCVGAALALNALGIITIATTEPGYATRQIAHLCLAMIAAAVVAAPHYHWLRRFSMPLLIVVVALLVFVLIPFVPEFIVRPRNGARRWISLYFMDFQPSELAKIAYIIALAAYLRYRKNYRRFLGLLLPLALTFIPMGLVLIEPDLGSAMLFLPTLFAMLIAAGAKLKHLVLIVLLGLAAAPAMYPLLQPHQKARIHALYYQLKGDQRHVQDIGYQGDKAMTLVGAGQVSGVGRRKAADLVTYNHLPEEHNDMVFAVIACRWGAAGALLTWGLYILLFLGGMLTAGQCRDPFGRLVAVGIVAILFAQMTINTGMTVGLMPITGMTLPFVSYGGSSLISVWIMVGLLLSVALRRPQYLVRESFEFDHEEEGAM
ncbi:MAG: FtsW/RodA/SpoVE family cell cycle protein [Planctomycetota bacterium]|nr:FtsW/RodA/SpoVE family cell cycle protein [Planctomycetota bacterium]